MTVFELEPHIMALLGAATAAIGAGIVVWGAAALGSNRSDGRSESLLAPTLAADTLDDDLRVVFARTLVLDARCQAKYGIDLRHRWSDLGRQLRRLLVSEQARRHVGQQPTDADDFVELLEHGLDHVLAGHDLDDRWHELVAETTDRITRDDDLGDPPARRSAGD